MKTSQNSLNNDELRTQKTIALTFYIAAVATAVIICPIPY